MGLKPRIKLVCPESGCDFDFKYHVHDNRMHPDDWVMTAASRAHLEEPHVKKPVLKLVQPLAEPTAA